MELDVARDSFLTRLNKTLEPGWQCRLTQDGRLFYLNHNNETSHWIPPRSNWPLLGQLPYGWEKASDKNAKDYYINHRTCSTTREDPFDLEEAPPEQRHVVLVRDPALGFGFIAGSERPVVIRSVTEGGPSIEKLLPGDEILRVNGEDVKHSDRQYIIDKIRYSTDEISLTVIQPYIDKTGLKSSFLSATKKQKLRAKPPRVRFAENVNTFPSNTPKIPPSLVYLPNVLKVYLENGQTKSFKYDDDTTVKEVVESLQEKLGIKCQEYFSLALEDVRAPSLNKLVILQEHESLRQIADRPGSQNWKCHLRVTYVPCDAYDLLNEDPQAFDYFYQQCCNDVLHERFVSDLKPDVTMKLAALQIHQHLLASKQPTKISIKAVEKDAGLDRFLPKSILSNWKLKELRKLISQYMKQNQNLTAPGQKHLTELQAKLHYLKIIGEMKTFGTKTFFTTILDFPDVDQQSDAKVIIGPRCEVSLVARTGDTAPVMAFSQLCRLLLTVESGTEEGVHRLELHQKSGQPIVFLMPSEDAQQMASFINGYYRLLVNRSRTLLAEDTVWIQPVKNEAPPYHGRHRVETAKWSYPDDVVSEVVADDGTSTEDEEETESAPKRRRITEGEHWVDLAPGPPPYEGDQGYRKKRSSICDRIEEDSAAEAAAEAERAETDEQKNGDLSDHKEYENTEPSHEHLTEERTDSSPSLEEDEASEERREEEVLSILSSSASSRESDVSVSISSPSKLNESPSKKEAKTGKTATSKKRDKSLTEGISKKIFKSITGMKFNVKDTVALNDSENVTAMEGKFSRSSPSRNYVVSECASTEEKELTASVESPVKEEGVGEERPNSRLRARDSILIQHRKMSPRPKRRSDTDESEDSEEDPSKSFDSDIIDLTNIGDFDFDSDLSPSKLSPDGDEDVFLEDVCDGKGEEDSMEVEADLGEECSLGTDQPAEADESLPVSEMSEEEIDIPSTADSEDGADEEREVDDEERLSAEQGDSNQVEDDEEDDEEEEDTPMSIIDSPSPERCARSPVDVSDEAHGMQLAALVALNASLDEADPPLQAAAKTPEAECESDSGNETISSEIENSNPDHAGVCQSPREFPQLVIASNTYHSVAEGVDSEYISTHSLKEEDNQELFSGAAGCATSSDNESTSTLHGSSPNLSAIDMEDRAPSGTPQHCNDICLASLDPPKAGEQSSEMGGYVDDIEALIATLVVPPPPPMDGGDIDEELLQAILAPPTLAGFDEGTIEGVLQGGVEVSDIDSCKLDASETEPPHIPPETSESVDELANALHFLKLPPEDEPQQVLGTVVLNGVDDHDHDMDRNSREESIPDRMSSEVPDLIENGKEENVHNSVEDVVEDVGSDMGDLDEEAGLRELLELTMTNAIGNTLPTDGEEQLDDQSTTTSPSENILDLLSDSTDTTDTLQNHSHDSEGTLDDKRSPPTTLHLQDATESDTETDDFEPNYDSYGRLRGQKSPEQKVADILDAIILGSMSSSAASTPSVSTPSVDRPLGSPGELDAKPHGMHQSKLQGSVDSGFHQPDQDQLSLASPSETASLSSNDNGFSRGDPRREGKDVLVLAKKGDLEARPVLETQSREASASVPPVRQKPSVPPKPPKPARPKDLKLKLIESEKETNPAVTSPRKSTKYPAPQPPQAPPRKRYTAPGIAAKASRFEHVSGFATLPKSFAPPPVQDSPDEHGEGVSTSELHARGRLHADGGNENNGNNVCISQSNSGEREKRSKPLARSHTFSDPSPTKESDKLYPNRRAPPPPLPKPKIAAKPTSSVFGKSAKLKESCSVSNSPQGSVSKKQSISGSLSRLLSPHRNKTWGQFKDSLPFKQGSLKGGGSTRSKSKSKSRKPLKALWPSATMDSPGESNGMASKEVHRTLSLETATRGDLQRSESAEFDLRPMVGGELRVRSFSMNMMRTNSEDSASASESDFDTPQGSPNLSQGGTLRGRPSSMISLTESYPPAFDSPRRPPPPRPSNPPVLKAASLSKLSTKMYLQTGSISPIPSSSPASPEPVPSPGSSLDADGEPASPSPPPLPASQPPAFTNPSHQESTNDPAVYGENDDNVANAARIIAIESKEYSGVTAISNAIADIEILAADMSDSISNLDHHGNAKLFRQTKESLLSEVREFTNNTKMVVSGAGQGGQQLRESTSSSMHTLARLCAATKASMAVMVSTAQAQNLGRKVEDVARNFSTTLQAANEAHGKALSDPRMQQLLRKAQTMAALLSALMRSLRMLQH